MAQASKRQWRQAQDIAIDLHERPYFGKTSQEEGLWVRSLAKDGTARFYRIATAYVIRCGLRVTLALHFFLPSDSIVSVLKTLRSSPELPVKSAAWVRRRAARR